ncbi:MAG: hypothetical protein OEU26_17920 [Candidatus Tectomicrobia bacterium]|nr:hypothetical protein [Candidatus Tectomicrobia bacterium]
MSFFKKEGWIGTGSWAAFPKDRVDSIFKAAAYWKETLKCIEKPWLCWSVDPEWCLIQQKLVAAVGWTPVVGMDYRSKKPEVISDAVELDFNKTLNLPGMWMHFPLEFVFLFADKLAFWHSDVLVPIGRLREVVRQFDKIPNGKMVGIYLDRQISISGLKARLKGQKPIPRWFEGLGCTTKEASKSQFDNGCGFWRRIELHPNAQEKIIQRNPHWEHGVGIYYWMKYFGGEVDNLCIDIDPYHYSRAGKYHKKSYSKFDQFPYNTQKGKELNECFSLEKIVKELDISIY